jgi:hypothetical protein
VPINIELSNIPEQRILLNKIDNARAYYALTILGRSAARKEETVIGV